MCKKEQESASQANPADSEETVPPVVGLVSDAPPGSIHWRNLQWLHRQNQNPEPSLLSFSPMRVLSTRLLNSSSVHTIYFPTLLSFFLHLVAMIRYLRDQLNIPIFNAGGSLPARLLNPLPPPPFHSESQITLS